MKSLRSVSLPIINIFSTLFSTKSSNCKQFPLKHWTPPITFWRKYWLILKSSTSLKPKLKYLTLSIKSGQKNLSKLHSIFWALITIRSLKSKRLSISLKSPSGRFLFVSLPSRKMIWSTKSKSRKLKKEKFLKLSFFKMDPIRLSLLSKRTYRNRSKTSQLSKTFHSETLSLKIQSLEEYLGAIWADYCSRYENLSHSTGRHVQYWWFSVQWSDTTKKTSLELIRPSCKKSPYWSGRSLTQCNSWRTKKMSYFQLKYNLPNNPESKTLPNHKW